jgi:hypothetical protein
VRNGLADHWPEILGPESWQVNEGDGVDGVDLLSRVMVGETSPLRSRRVLNEIAT